MIAMLRGIALCAVGLEKIAAQELERLGFRLLERNPGRVYFKLDEKNLARDLAKANIGLRTVERVLLEMGSFQAPDFDAYFDGMRSLPWELCCFKDSAIHIDRVRSHASALAAQTSLQAMGQKAVYSRLMETYDMRTMPANGNRVSVRVYLDKDICSVGVDTSGDPLHKRGYRKKAVMAPLKETVAASLLFFSGWNRKFPLVDPFCGSGTIAIEAAMYALDMAPGLMRRFAFESMPMSSPKTIELVRDEFEAKIRNDVEFDIHASDIDSEALEAARSNAYSAGISDWIDFRLAKAETLKPHRDQGYVLANPPYGNRMGTEEEAIALYGDLSDMRDCFREAGWGLGFITAREDFASLFGIEPQIIKHLVNGAEEQWFHWYPSAGKGQDAADSLRT
jgi:putative N6-adenine-specific DNA methylase